MKHILILLLSFYFTIAAFAQQNPADTNFTNKAEAKNLMLSGLKEGKWMEYINTSLNITTDTNTPSYCLTVYKAGKPYGIRRIYLKTGKLLMELPYVNGKLNGVKKTYYESGRIQSELPLTNGKASGLEKLYYENGKIWSDCPWSDGKRNGVAKWYYESGAIQMEIPYTGDKRNGVAKWYYESGKVKTETTYTKGVKGITKIYDEHGNEFK